MYSTRKTPPNQGSARNLPGAAAVAADVAAAAAADAAAGEAVRAVRAAPVAAAAAVCPGAVAASARLTPLSDIIGGRRRTLPNLTGFEGADWHKFAEPRPILSAKI